MKKRALKILLPIAILAAAGATTAVMIATKSRPVAKPAEEKTFTVKFSPVAVRDVRPRLILYGEIVAGREADLRPLVVGRIVEVGPRLLEGASVRTGDLIATIDPFDYRLAADEAEASVAEGEARLREYQSELASERELIGAERARLSLLNKDLERTRDLRKRGVGTQKAVDDSELKVIEARRAVGVRTQTIGRMQARGEQQAAVIARMGAALDRARRDLEETRLIAPFAGFLTEVDAAVGKRVGVGDRIARLIDTASLEAAFDLPDAIFARLYAEEAAGGRGLVGRRATVRWRVGDHAFGYTATIDRVAGRIDQAIGGVKVFARIDGGGDSAALRGGAGGQTALRPGAFVEVELADRLYRDVIRLPASALAAGDLVYLEEDGRAAARKVSVIGRISGDVLVRGDLPVGARVVSSPPDELGPGALLRAASGVGQ